MTPAEVRALPVTMPLWPDAARPFGGGRDWAYRAARDGTFPCPVLRLGRRLVVRRADLLAALGIPDDDGEHRPAKGGGGLHAA